MASTEDKLASLLPERNGEYLPAQKQVVADVISEHADKLRMKELNAHARKLLAKAKYYKAKYGNPEGYEPEFDSEGNFIEPLYDPREVAAITKNGAPDKTPFDGKQLKKIMSYEDAVVVKEPLIDEKETRVMLTGQYAHLNSTTSPYIQNLLKRMNIDETVKLTKTDLSDLLSTVMMMNEDQLNEMMKNKKIPVVIRILIRALYNDMRIGNLETLDKLWDRIFGKPTTHQTVEDNRSTVLSEILPGVTKGPVSREAYILIKDKLLGEK